MDPPTRDQATPGEHELLSREVRQLSRSMAELQERLGALERHLGHDARRAAAAHGGEARERRADREGQPPVDALPGSASGVPVELTFAGRTLLVLAGGYLLRALAEGGTLEPRLGVLLGLLYAAGWIVAADRAAARGRRQSAGFHAAAAALIGMPLIWETTRVFHLLPPAQSAGALAALMLLLLAVGWRHDHPAPAWLAALGGSLVALLLLRLAPVPFGALLLVHGAASLWAALSRSWPVVPWVTAGAANLGVLLVMARSPGEALPLQLALLLVYAGTFVAIALLPARRVGALAFVQTPMALALGYGAPLVAAEPTLRAALGGAGIAAGIAVYALGLQRLDRSRRADLAYLSLLGLLLLLAGSAAALPAAALTWALLAVAATLIGRRMGRFTLSLHGAFLALAAAAGTGLVTTAAYVWAAPASSPWPALGFSEIAALAAALLCLGVPLPDQRAHWEEGAYAPRLLLLGLAAFGGGATLLQAWARLGGDLAGPGADPALLSVARTATLAALTLGLALTSRWSGLREPYWLVYALLALGGLKLLGEDLLRGQPATLVVSLALYGAALILAPRLGRRA